MNTLASLQHPNLCKLIGYHARDGSEKRMLVYERLYHGSLDRLLYGRSDGPTIDWNARMKVAFCAAQGLTFLHEEGPFQVLRTSSLLYSSVVHFHRVQNNSSFCQMLSLYLQAMFNEFSTANIQIDKDFSAKLSGYGCINHIPETEIRNSSVVSALILLKTRILLYFNTFLY